MSFGIDNEIFQEKDASIKLFYVLSGPFELVFRVIFLPSNSLKITSQNPLARPDLRRAIRSAKMCNFCALIVKNEHNKFFIVDERKVNNFIFALNVYFEGKISLSDSTFDRLCEKKCDRVKKDPFIKSEPSCKERPKSLTLRMSREFLFYRISKARPSDNLPMFQN